MDVEVVEKLTAINPYILAIALVATVAICVALGRLVFWLVKYIITKHETEGNTVVSELKDAIHGLRTSQEANTKELRNGIHEMSQATQTMASNLRERIDQESRRMDARIAGVAGELTNRIDNVAKDANFRIDEVHDRVSSAESSRGKLAADVKEIKGRCDDRAKMCPHVRGEAHGHCDNCGEAC